MMFYFRLAQELGLTISRMLEEMSSHELGCWMAFLSVEDSRRRKEQEEQRRKKSETNTKLLRASVIATGEAAERKRKKRDGKM